MPVDAFGLVARTACAALLMALAPAALAQGFVGLAAPEPGFAVADPETRLQFPADHGPHPDFRIEWWYLTANLEGEDGRPYGVQFTLFRQAAEPPPQRDGWASQQFWLGHAAVTTETAHFFASRLARGGVGQAGVVAAPFAAWIDDWRFGAVDGAPGLSKVSLAAGGADFSYALTLTTDAAPVLQGVAGFSRKSDRGQASHYYSQPYFTVTGALTLGGRRVAVTGQGWMDREWSSQWLEEDQPGWDWFSLHLEGGAKLMAFRLRQTDGEPYVSGNWIENGDSVPFGPGVLSAEPVATAQVAGREIPVRWRLRLPARGLDVTIDAINPQAWNGGGAPYWEGPIRVVGSHGGVGYLEMVGY